MATTAPQTPNSTGIIAALVVMVGMTLAAIVAVTVTRPEADNTAIITSILTIMIPTTAALAAYLRATQATVTVQEVHTQINSRMDQLLVLTASASRAEGVVEGASIAPPLPATPEELRERARIKWEEGTSKLEEGERS